MPSRIKDRRSLQPSLHLHRTLLDIPVRHCRMQNTPRLWSAALPRVLASPSIPLTTGKTATHALHRNATPSISAYQRTVTTSGARTAAASPTFVKTASTDKSKTPYSNYTSTPISATSRTTKKAVNAERAVTATPTSKTSDPVFDSTFPVPQPAAALPDYAALAPPLNPPPSSAIPPHSIHLVEAPGFGDSSESLHAQNDWSTSFHGLSSKPFDKEVAQILMRPLDIKDIEIKPGMPIILLHWFASSSSGVVLADGLLYLPEIKYRRTLNEAFGPGGWGMAPRGETTIGQRIISREWGLVCLGR